MEIDYNPAFLRWVIVKKNGKVPAGTEETVLSSLPGLASLGFFSPALKRWAILRPVHKRLNCDGNQLRITK